MPGTRAAFASAAGFSHHRISRPTLHRSGASNQLRPSKEITAAERISDNLGVSLRSPLQGHAANKPAEERHKARPMPCPRADGLAWSYGIAHAIPPMLVMGDLLPTAYVPCRITGFVLNNKKAK